MIPFPSSTLRRDQDALLFQCLDIHTQDCIVIDNTSDESDSDFASRSSSGSGSSEFAERAPPNKNDTLALKHFQILMFGSDSHGRSVCLQVEDFRPYFFVRLPEGLTCEGLETFEDWIREQLPGQCRSLPIMHRERHKTLLDYTHGFAADFLRIEVPSQGLWRILKDVFLTRQSTPRIYAAKTMFGSAEIAHFKKSLITADGQASVGYWNAATGGISLRLYEANIDPVLRFFHERDVSPAGWVTVPAGEWEWTEGSAAKAVQCVSCDWRSVQPVNNKNVLAPLTVASWDIECMSSHGDFPLATKTWRKPVRELAEARARCPTSVENLCEALAAAVRGDITTGSLLSPVYLKRTTAAFGSNTSWETIRFVFEGKNVLGTINAQLTALRQASNGGEREAAIAALDDTLTKVLPALRGDEIIQIGTVLYRHEIPVSKHIWVLGDVVASEVKPPGVEVPVSVYSYTDEFAMLKAWIAWMGRTDADVIIGYNIFGFDERYVWERLLELGGGEKAKVVKEAVRPWSRLRSRPPRLEEKFLSSSAMGDNTMHILGSVGRLHIDLLPHIRRSYNLDSYTLDNVSATFMSGAVTGALAPFATKGLKTGHEVFRFPTKSTKGIVAGRYITLMDVENDRVVDRCEVLAVEPKALVVAIEGGQAALDDHGLAPARWAQVKDDVSPKDIFRLHRGTASDRAVVAKYCLQDCDLVMELFYKLDILNNSIAMASVCSVPVSYIFLRGQGIKIESLIFKECRRVDQLIEVMPAPSREELEAEHRRGEFMLDDVEEGGEEGEDTYEGAIVLEPHTGIYIDDPVTADDFASLYPSSIISENISHDTLIWVKDWDNAGNFVCCREGSDRFDNLPDAKYVSIEFDILRPDPAEAHKKHPRKIRDGRRVARYIQNPQGTIPKILEMLLASRKRCRKLAESEPDEFTRNLLDAQQLAYKLTANSLYGQLGSATFKIRRQVLAASTTAYGRKQLMFAKAVIEDVYGGGRDPRCNVECVYGDTDSIFLRFQPRNPETGEKLHGKAALQAAKDLTVESGKLVSSCLKPPHDFEFDKIFRSFILLSKKRYVGDMSEDGVEDDDFHRKSMGIVMKRRDNAPIVKYVYGHAIDAILDPTRLDVRAGVQEAAAFVQKATRDLLAGRFPMSKLTITKSLRAGYADPTRIAHKVLADRIAERDPGNKPSTTDRIPFVFFVNTDPKAKLTGDKIELPSYIREHALRPDYAHYVTNQIAKPVSQVFALGLKHMLGVRPAELRAAQVSKKPVEAREKLANKVLFEPLLIEAARDPLVMEARGQRSIATMFGARSSQS